MKPIDTYNYDLWTRSNKLVHDNAVIIHLIRCGPVSRALDYSARIKRTCGEDWWFESHAVISDRLWCLSMFFFLIWGNFILYFLDFIFNIVYIILLFYLVCVFFHSLFLSFHFRVTQSIQSNAAMNLFDCIGICYVCETNCRVRQVFQFARIQFIRGISFYSKGGSQIYVGHTVLERIIGGGHKMFYDQNVGSHTMTTESVLFYSKRLISIQFWGLGS